MTGLVQAGLVQAGFVQAGFLQAGLDASATWLLPTLLAVPLVGSMLIALVGALLPTRTSLVTWLGLLTSAVTFGLTLVIARAMPNWAATSLEVNADWLPAFGLSFHLGIDGVSLPLVMLTALLVLLCMISLLVNPPEGGSVAALVALVLLLETGMLATFVSLDLLLFFICFEIVLIPMWFVITRWGDSHDAAGRVRAANVFLLYTVIGSGVMLLGFMVIYANAGTFDMTALVGGAGMSTSAQTLAAVLVVLGLAVKTPMWPLHTWLPDAHAKAPTVGSVLLAGVLLKMGTYGLIRIAVPILPEGMKVVAPWLGAFGVLGIVMAGLACLAQTDLKRLIAYSSVGHMGFVLLGVSTLSVVGINAAMYSNIAHGLITGLLFFLAGAIKDRHGTSALAGIGRGLYRRAPHLGALVAFTAIASVGVPGLAGFWGEFLALASAIDVDNGLPVLLYRGFVVVALLGTVLAALYLLGLVRRMCQGEPDTSGPGAAVIADVTRLEWVTWTPLVLLIVACGVWPGFILSVVNPAVTALVGGP